MPGRKIAIDAGHFLESWGAGNKELNLKEYEEAKKIVEKIWAMLTDEGFRVVGFEGTVSDKIKLLNKYDNLDCVIEIHFNACEKRNQQGTMTLYCPEDISGKPQNIIESGKRLAIEIQKQLIEYLKTRDLGIRQGWYRLDPLRGPLAMLYKVKFPCIVVECLFIDNMIEGKRLVSEINTHSKIAMAIFRGVCNFCKEDRHVE